jgi:hypothetical protein
MHIHLEKTTLGTNRCRVGRDTEYIKRAQAHSMCVFFGAIVINSMPRPFRSVAGLIISWACYLALKRLSRVGLPIITERLAHTARLREEPYYPWTPPVSGQS